MTDIWLSTDAVDETLGHITSSLLKDDIEFSHVKNGQSANGYVDYVIVYGVRSHYGTVTSFRNGYGVYVSGGGSADFMDLIKKNFWMGPICFYTVPGTD